MKTLNVLMLAMVLCGQSAKAAWGGIYYANSLSKTDVGYALWQAYTNGSGTVILPDGSNAWTSRLVVTNSNVFIAGAGTQYAPNSNPNTNGTVLTIDNSDPEEPLFELKGGTFVTVASMQLRGMKWNTNNTGWPLSIKSKWCTVMNVQFERAAAGVVWFQPGYMRNCYCYNNERHVRCKNDHGGQDNVDAGYVSTYDQTIMGTTNFTVIETNLFANWDMSTDTQTAISSQEGAMWCARFNTFSNYNGHLDPVFDCHGGLSSSIYGVFASQIYKNTILAGGTTYYGSLVDNRGGMNNCFSNTIIGSVDPVRYRIKDDDINYYVTPGPKNQQSYSWQNTENGNDLGTEVDPNDQSTIIENTDFFHYAPSTLYTVPYPYPHW